MDKNLFEILLASYGEKKQTFKMQVEIIHCSEQLLRFRVFAGKKSMVMEKLLKKNKGQWKVKEMNFSFTGNPKDVSRSIMDIQDQIDFFMAGQPKPVSKYKDK